MSQNEYLSICEQIIKDKLSVHLNSNLSNYDLDSLSFDSENIPRIKEILFLATKNNRLNELNNITHFIKCASSVLGSNYVMNAILDSNEKIENIFKDIDLLDVDIDIVKDKIMSKGYINDYLETINNKYLNIEDNVEEKKYRKLIDGVADYIIGHPENTNSSFKVAEEYIREHRSAFTEKHPEVLFRFRDEEFKHISDNNFEKLLRSNASFDNSFVIRMMEAELLKPEEATELINVINGSVDLENITSKFSLAYLVYRKGLVFTDEVCKKIKIFNKVSYSLQERILSDNPNNILYLDYNNLRLLNMAIDKGFNLSYENLSRMPNLYRLEAIDKALEYDINNFDYFLDKVINIDYLDHVLNNGYVLTGDRFKRIINESDDAFSSDTFIINAILDNPSNLLEYQGESVIFNYILTQVKNKNINVNSLDSREDIIELVKEGKKFAAKYEDALKIYKFDKRVFCENEYVLNYFVAFANIKLDDFIKYNFGSSFNWLIEMKEIINTGSINGFANFYKFIIEKANANNSLARIKYFKECLKNYRKYQELCDDITDKKEVNLDLMMALFSRNEEINEEFKPRSLDELPSFPEKLINSSMQKYEETNGNPMAITLKKNIICSLLFNKSYYEVEEYLKIYGKTIAINQMVFDDKNDKEVKDVADLVVVITSMFEAICDIKEEKQIDELWQNMLKNSELITKCSGTFSRYEKLVRVLYAKDMNYNLTKFELIKNINKYLDKETPSIEGIPVYNFENVKYGLLAHVVSGKEDFEGLINGEDSNGHIFISMSAISHLGVGLYHTYFHGVVIGYDEIPTNNFILSSPKNLSSNNLLSQNNIDVNVNRRNQKGFLDTSYLGGKGNSVLEANNSEVLCYRTGLKPRCIVIPAGTKIDTQKIELARQYGLFFVKTQSPARKLDEFVEDIEYNEKNYVSTSDIKEELLRAKRELLSISKPRKIAIFTDSHGLYEPTLAVLEAARKSGVTEIYSLGDNIGNGATPSEVMDLLSEYNVKSVKGNHEHYVVDGIKDFARHLHGYMYDEAYRDSEWTRSQLRPDQLLKIKDMPEEIELNIGGKKVLLCHYTKDYNTKNLRYNLNNYDYTYQGHLHYENVDPKVMTIRGVGIGHNLTGEESGMAYYLELTETDGGYTTEIKYVPYALENALIDNSLGTSPSKRKMDSWIR